MVQQTKNSKINQPRTIIYPLLNFKDKENIFKYSRKLKRTKKFVDNDFCQESHEHRRELWKEVKCLRRTKIRLLIWIIVRLLSEVETLKIKLASLLVVKWKQAYLECKLKIAPNSYFESFFICFFFKCKKALLIMKTTMRLIFTTMFLLLIQNTLHLINLKEHLSHFQNSRSRFWISMSALFVFRKC